MGDRAKDSADEFASLLAPHARIVQGLALKLTRSAPDADDVVQESLYRALRGFATFQRGTNFRAWILRIVTNTFLQIREKEARRAHAPVDEEATGGRETEAHPVESLFTFGWEALADQLDEELKRAVEALPDEFRLPLLMSSLVGLSHKEIGVALGIPVGTVMSRLYRARQRLMAALGAALGRRVSGERSS